LSRPLAHDRHRRFELPYGIWRCRGGREVLFNRCYQPIWQRQGDIIQPAERTNRITGITAQAWFYSAADLVHRARLVRRLTKILRDFRAGRPVTPRTRRWTR
jgi:hypothetical protein